MHIYTTKEGIEVPSVTTILKILDTPGIPQWANYLGFKHINYEKELNRYATFGTLAHNFIEHLLHDKSRESFEFKNDYDKSKCYQIADNFFNQMQKFSYKSIAVELTLSSSKLGYGGTLDWYCKLEESLALLDFKTSKKVREKHLLQLGGYYNLLVEHGYVCNIGGVTLLGTDRCIIYPVNDEELKHLGKVFNAITEVYFKLNKLTIESYRTPLEQLIAPF